MAKPFVAILVDSDSEFAAIRHCVDVLERLEVEHEVKIASAHRTTKAVQDYVSNATERGCGVFICIATVATHLASTVASQTLKPVISASLHDATLSTTQTPNGIPVTAIAAVNNDTANAAHFAAQILAVSNIALAQRIRRDRDTNAQAVIAKDAMLQQKLNQ